MLLAPLAVVFALVAIDYGVWNWAIGGNHEVVALVAGLAMAPLVIALAWLGALALGSGAITVARRVGRELATRVLGARPARSLRLAQAPRPRRGGPKSGGGDPPRNRIAA
jgi:hypothetical protein